MRWFALLLLSTLFLVDHQFSWVVFEFVLSFGLEQNLLHVVLICMFYGKCFCQEIALRIFRLWIVKIRSLLKWIYILTWMTLQLLLTCNSVNFSHHLLFHCGVLCYQYQHKEESHRQSIRSSNHHLQHTLVHILSSQISSVLKEILGKILVAALWYQQRPYSSRTGMT